MSTKHHVRADRDIVEKIKNWLLNYIATFDNREAQFRRVIELKKKHSFRVCKEILTIGTELHLDEVDLHRAQIMAILHDTGRFEQYARHQTFIDQLSLDHAALAVKIITENSVLDRLDPASKDLILKAIRYHNLRILPHDETEQCLFFSKLLRDADKLDIWRVFIEHQLENKNGASYGRAGVLPDTPGISDGVYSDLTGSRIVDFDHVSNQNDLKLLRMGWVYDIGFTPTYKLIKEREYLKRIKATLLQSTVRIRQVCSKMEAYLDEKSESSKLVA